MEREQRQAARNLDREARSLARRRRANPPMRSGAPRSVSNCPSSAASLIGCHAATVRALMSPESGCSTAAGAPIEQRERQRVAMKRRIATLRSTNARECPATARPVAAYAASSMCSACWNVDGLNMPGDRIDAARSVRRSHVSPVGVFIHALTITTNTADAAPLTATITPAARCARGEIRSQPYR